MGDFNIHVDNVEDGCAKELYYGYLWTFTACNRSNTVDVVVTDVALSDHYCFQFKMTIPASISKGEKDVMRTWSINNNTCTLFNQAFTPSPAWPSASVNDLVNSFSSSLITTNGCQCSD